MLTACSECAIRLDAPFGARCFLTAHDLILDYLTDDGLNAPFGARCFMTLNKEGWVSQDGGS